jgi:pimeloyl-ACP methyl ester carboxylesterase
VTLYLHNIGFGQWYWRFKAVPGYDYATELARLGHASVVYDQLGYGSSDRSVGTQNCYGGEADIASQIVGKLRSGSYTAAGRSAPRFGKVALASHAVGGLMTQPEAYSFRDVDALIVTSWADQGFSEEITEEAVAVNALCASGGEPKDGKPGYVYSPRSSDYFKRLYFANAEPAVVDAATAMRERSPCGEPQSALASVAADQAFLREVTVPVLLVYGKLDAFHDQPSSGQQQKGLYSGTRDLTAAFLENTGSALALERSAPEFRRLVADWLRARGFSVGATSSVSPWSPSACRAPLRVRWSSTRKNRPCRSQ